MNDEDIEMRWKEFSDLLKSTGRSGVNELLEWLSTKTDFKIAPASTKYHLNCRGGLLEHSLNVYHVLKDDMASYIELLNIPESTVIISSLLHDVCKANMYIEEMRNVKKGNVWVQEPFYKSDDQFPARHAEKSVILVLSNSSLKLTEQEIMMMCGHMGFSNTPPYESQISDLFTRYPEALLLHFADLSSTYFIEVNSEGTDKFNYCGYKDMFKGRSAVSSLKIIENSKNINIDGFEYKLAPEDAIVDGIEVIFMQNGDKQIKVYAPHKDGLPY